MRDELLFKEVEDVGVVVELVEVGLVVGSDEGVECLDVVEVGLADVDFKGGLSDLGLSHRSYIFMYSI